MKCAYLGVALDCEVREIDLRVRVRLEVGCEALERLRQTEIMSDWA